MTSIYDQHLDKNPANHVALTPVSFVERSAEIFGDLEAVIHGKRRYNWAQVRDRSARLAAALQAAGVRKGSTVSVMLSNTPEMIEAHYAIPALNAVLNALNTRLDAELLAWQINHCEAMVLLTDLEFSTTMAQTLAILENRYQRQLLVIDVCDAEFEGEGVRLGSHDYESWLQQHQPLATLHGPSDEWDAIAVSYTSGTTGDPKGVVTHHRGAYLNAVSNAVTWHMPHFSRYLWTLPMFHCNGWCFPWTIAMLGGVHICLRKIDAQLILNHMAAHQVNYYCAAPIVHNLLINAPSAWLEPVKQQVKGMVAGAAPPASMIEGMVKLGFDITHVYGLTEVYGPASVAVKRPSWAASEMAEQVRLNGRQGVRYVLQEGMNVQNPDTMTPVQSNGKEMGEIMFKGNIVMKGYLKNPSATNKAFAGGWFHTGDLAVSEADHYIKIKDRSKDIIISGGENISSIEVEEALYRHPDVLVCAVVAMQDDKWGEVPVAFVEIKQDSALTSTALMAHCKKWLASYKCPKAFVFESIPRTSTGKIQKFLLRDKANSEGLGVNSNGSSG